MTAATLAAGGATKARPPVAPCGPADRDFCRAVLPEVSRTFALSIAALPAGLQEPVLAAYLLCRIVDTIEDEPALPRAVRERLFDAFAGALAYEAADPARFERLVTAANLAEGLPDGELCRRAGAPLRLFRSLSAAQRRVIRPRVSVMLEGMRSFCRRVYREGTLRLRDLEELEQYCYYVAGSVGRLLTDLFVQATPGLSAGARRQVGDAAVSFGIGLQLVNIVKDVAEDLGRGISFLPESLAHAHGIELGQILEPANHEAGMAVVRTVCARARYHLDQARTYTLSWPAASGGAVRLFCAVPLSLAFATLAVVESGEQTLSRDGAPKISRETVGQILAEAHAAVRDDTRLAALLRAPAQV